MAKVRRSRAESKAEISKRLVKVARSYFRDYGYANTSMVALTESIGLTRGAIYHNFGGKEALFEAVVRQIDQETSIKLEAASKGDLTLSSFLTTCYAYLEFTLDPEIQKIMFQDAPSVLGQRFRYLDQEGSIEPLKQALEMLMDNHGVVKADAEALAVMLNGAMIDSALWIALQDDTQAALTRAYSAFEILVKRLSV